MTDTSIIFTVGGGVFAILFSIIGFFLRGIYNKLESTQTVKGCETSMSACKATRVLEAEMARERRTSDRDKIDELVDAFDSLCKCLKDYTKGVCP